MRSFRLGDELLQRSSAQTAELVLQYTLHVHRCFLAEVHLSNCGSTTCNRLIREVDPCELCMLIRPVLKHFISWAPLDEYFMNDSEAN